MSRSQIRPLKTLTLRPLPFASHAISWSCDAELAVATEDSIYIFLPDYPRPGGEDDDDDAETQKHQFALSIHATGIFLNNPAVNGKLCESAGIRLPPVAEDGPKPAPPPSRQVTGRNASVSQIIRVEWSPNGVGANLRPVLTAMTTNGELITLGEMSDSQSGETSGASSRDTKMWKILWGLGAGMPIPAEEGDGSYRTMDDRITSFAWAREISPGRALLAYATDEGDVVVIAVRYSARDRAWKIGQVARFDATGPHEEVNSMDPDYVPGGTAFALQWSPWLVDDEGSWTASLAYIAKNHIGFRQVSIRAGWQPDQEPDVEVRGSDSLGICLFLSTDAFVQWEDTIWDQDGAKISRGIICTPFKVVPFQVDVLEKARPPVMRHRTSECATTYPDSASTNPIAGLFIHRPSRDSKPASPLYTAVRTSATAMNHDWFETNVSDAVAVPPWASKIKQSTQRQVSRMDALDMTGMDSDSDDTDEGFEEGDGPGFKVSPYRFRFWGLASSPGGGSTVALVSKYSTQRPMRQRFCKLLFGAHKGDIQEDQMDFTSRLTTEAKMWEWMYGGGGGVPFVTGAPGHGDVTPDSPLRQFFQRVRSLQKCVFCDGNLRNNGIEAVCTNKHAFATCSSTGLAVLAPGISHICAVCQRRRLRMSELQRLASGEEDADTNLRYVGECCGNCGGKFVT